MKNYILTALLYFVAINTGVLSQIIITTDTCNFEDSCSMIKLDTPLSNIWEVGQPSKILFDSAFSTNKALMTDSLNYYPTNNQSSFIITIKDGTYQADAIEIKFKYKLDTDSLLDGGYIDVSFDGGGSWYDFLDQANNNMGVWVSSSSNLYLSDTLFNGKYGISGTNTEWSSGILESRFYAPMDQFIDSMMIRFNFISDSIQNNREGWMIDDLMVIKKFYSNVEENGKFKISTFPNPTNEKIAIEIDDIGKYDNLLAHVIDNLGRVILTYPINNTKSKISLENVPNGLYHIVVKENNNVIGKSKIIKQ